MLTTLLRSTASITAVSTALLSSVTTHAQNTPEKPPHDEIIVTGSPLSATTGESLVGVSVIGGEELASNLAGSLGETLKTVPGLSSTFFGPGASRPVIRGQGGDRIRILDNGIGSIDASSASPDHATSVEPAMAKRVEIIRGSGLLRYGSSASGGVINVIDGRIPDNVPDKPLSGAARIGASSVDDGYEGAIGVDIQLGAFGTGTLVGHVDATYRKTKDYSIPGFAESEILHAYELAEEEEHHDDGDEDHGDEDHDDDHDEEARGILENSATKSRSFSGGLSWLGTNGSMFGMSVRNLDSTYGIPGGHAHHDEDEDHDEDDDHDEDHEEEGGVTVDLKQTRIDGLARFELSGLFDTLTINGGYGDYTHSEIEPDGAVGTVFSNEGYEARAELVQTEHGDWHGAYGAQIRKRDFSAIGEEAFVPPTSATQWGVFTFQEFDMASWHFETGLRYERNTLTNDTINLSRSFDSFSVSGGVDFHLSDTTRLGGTVFSTSRAPTTEELFSNGPHLATNQYEIGDINLGNERARGGEISVRYRKAGSHASFNVFVTDYNDYIYEFATGAEQDELPVFQFTATDAIFKGFEFEAGVKLATIKNFDFLVDGSVEYVDANLSTDGSALPRIPPLGLALGLVLENDDWRLRAELDHAAKQDDIAQGELETEAYTLVNLQASYHINERVSLRGSINNLFDQDARQHTSFLKDVVPLPRRNLKLSLSVDF